VALTDPAWAPATAVRGLGVLAFGASAVGLVVLLDDVAGLRDADAAWQPSAWAVLAPGTAVAAAVLLALVGPPADADPAFYGGVLLVAAVYSPAVVGPAYLLLRGRRLGDDER
jgi:hypothetical protein